MDAYARVEGIKVVRKDRGGKGKNQHRHNKKPAWYLGSECLKV